MADIITVGFYQRIADSQHATNGEWPTGRVLASQALLVVTYNSQSIQMKAAVGDVGPVTRQSLTRTEGFFDDLLLLTLCDKLIRGQVPE